MEACYQGSTTEVILYINGEGTVLVLLVRVNVGFVYIVGLVGRGNSWHALLTQHYTTPIVSLLHTLHNCYCIQWSKLLLWLESAYITQLLLYVVKQTFAVIGQLQSRNCLLPCSGYIYIAWAVLWREIVSELQIEESIPGLHIITATGTHYTYTRI